MFEWLGVLEIGEFYLKLIDFQHQSTQKYSEIIDSKLNSIIIRLKFAPLFNCELTKRLPTQFIRSSGIDCTKYSRCSFDIVHIGRFFWVISSSRSFSDCNNSGNQISSHKQINGLSGERKKMHQMWHMCLIIILWYKLNLVFYSKIRKNSFCDQCFFVFSTYRQCRPHAMYRWLAPSLPPVFVVICYSECSTFPVNLDSRMLKPVEPKCCNQI